MCELVSVAELRQQFKPSVYQYRSAEHITVLQTSRGKLFIRKAWKQQCFSIVAALEEGNSTQFIRLTPERTNFGIGGRRNTYPKSTVIYLAILDFSATKQQKSTYVDFSVLAQGNILRCFFIIQIANYSRHISITSSTAKAVPLPQQGRLIKQKASLSRDSIFLLAFFLKCPLKTVNEE